MQQVQKQLQTVFAERIELADYVGELFPGARARGAEVSETRGGRRAAEALLRQVRPDAYARTRNRLDGAVTRLSPYLRHGVISLAEVREEALKHASPRQAYKLLQELAWRDYYQRVYARLGDDVWEDVEPYKTGVRSYQRTLPVDIVEGKTGLACIDAFSRDLREHGYLHNHARMWTAAYVVHHRRVRWQAGAHWFLQHLLDGDPASNNLSWQWVASTFAAKPYYFNQENLANYTGNSYCRNCPLLHHGCPFEASYEQLEDRLFSPVQENTHNSRAEQGKLTLRLSLRSLQDETNAGTVGDSLQADKVLVWLHEDCLDPQSSALAANPGAIPVFVFDSAAIESAGWTLKRLLFIYECLLEIPGIQIYIGSPKAVLSTLVAEQQEAGKSVALATMPAVDPRLRRIMRDLERRVPLYRYPVTPYVADVEISDLRRFALYWRQAEHAATNPQV